MERRLKKSGGITLVALIITIIIMLILVAVSVNVIIKSNLIGTAEKTANGFRNVQEKENSGTITINDKEYASIEEYVNEHNWQYTDETRGAIKCTCEICKTFDDGDGRIIEIGTQIGEAETINSSVTVTAAETGHDTDQTITANGTVRWVVLGYEDQDENGTNETLLLTTDTVIGDELYLKGAVAYNNAVDTEEKDGIITKVCKGLYGERVRNMKIEDVNRAMGIEERICYTIYMSPANGLQYWYRTGSYVKASTVSKWNQIKTTTASDGKLYSPAYPEGILLGEETTAEEVLGNYELGGYNYTVKAPVGSIYNQEVVKESISNLPKFLVFGSTFELEYWLASCGSVLMDISTSYITNFGVCFSVGCVRGGVTDVINCQMFSQISDGNSSKAYYVRPVLGIN